MDAELRKLKAEKHRLTTRLWIIKAADDGKFPYALYYKNLRTRRIKEIECRYELRKVEGKLNNYDSAKSI